MGDYVICGLNNEASHCLLSAYRPLVITGTLRDDEYIPRINKDETKLVSERKEWHGSHYGLRLEGRQKVHIAPLPILLAEMCS